MPSKLSPGSWLPVGQTQQWLWRVSVVTHRSAVVFQRLCCVTPKRSIQINCKIRRPRRELLIALWQPFQSSAEGKDNSPMWAGWEVHSFKNSVRPLSCHCENTLLYLFSKVDQVIMGDLNLSRDRQKVAKQYSPLPLLLETPIKWLAVTEEQATRQMGGKTLSGSENKMGFISK